MSVLLKLVHVMLTGTTPIGRRVRRSAQHQTFEEVGGGRVDTATTLTNQLTADRNLTNQLTADRNLTNRVRRSELRRETLPTKT